MMRMNHSQRSSERGGVTILVALVLLGLLTIAAMGMSRNSLREVMISGTTRQGAMARNAADSGIEWTIHWMHLDNLPSGTDSAQKLGNLKSTLLSRADLAGRAYKVNPAGGDLELYTYNASDNPATDHALTPYKDQTQGYTLGLTRMGKLPITEMSQGIGQGAFTPATGGEAKAAPDLWAMRSDGRVKVGGLVFKHSKEAWFTTPISN